MLCIYCLYTLKLCLRFKNLSEKVRAGIKFKTKKLSLLGPESGFSKKNLSLITKKNIILKVQHS